MKRLTEKEEQIMQIIWENGKIFIKEIREEMPDPKPHYNTIATTVRILEDKGFIGHDAFGNTYRFFPKIKKEDYRSQFLGRVMGDYFDNSYKQLVSFFARSEKISVEDLQDIIDLIEEKKNTRDE